MGKFLCRYAIEFVVKNGESFLHDLRGPLQVDEGYGAADGIAVGRFQGALADSGAGGGLPCPVGSGEIGVAFRLELGIGGKIVDAQLGDQNAVDGERTIRADRDFAGRNLDGLKFLVGLSGENFVALLGDEVPIFIEMEAAIAVLAQSIRREDREKTGAFGSDVS